MQGFDVNRLTRSVNNFIYANQIAARLCDFFLSLQEIEPRALAPASGPKADPPARSQPPSYNGTTGNRPGWPLPLIIELKEAVSKISESPLGCPLGFSDMESIGPSTDERPARPQPSILVRSCPTGQPSGQHVPDGVEALAAFIRATKQGGLLLGLAGPVGSGKTTLLHELMWQLWISKGEAIAFSAQKVWISRGSVASEIFFCSDAEGRGMSPEAAYGDKWLQTCVDACGLRSDIEGEKGFVRFLKEVYAVAPLYVSPASFDDCMQASLKASTKMLVKTAACYLADNVHAWLWPVLYMLGPT